jgi:hypothetical protein
MHFFTCQQQVKTVALLTPLQKSSETGENQRFSSLTIVSLQNNQHFLLYSSINGSVNKA